MLRTLIIDDFYLNEILFEVDAVLTSENSDDITLADLSLSKDDLKNKICLPAVREYLKFVPITLLTEYEVHTNFSFDFPNDDVVSVISHTFNSMPQLGRVGTNSIFSNAFFNSAYIASMGSANMWETGNDYGFQFSRQSGITSKQGYINQKKNNRFDIDKINRKITGFTNIAPNWLTVKWGLSTNDFEKIPEIDKDLVLNMCKVRLLQKIITVRSQVSEVGYNEFSIDELKDRKDNLDETNKLELRERTKGAILQ